MVEMVLLSPEPNVYEARAVDGSVRFTRHRRDGGPEFSVTSMVGRDPLADQDPAHLAPPGRAGGPQPDRRPTATRWPSSG